jgi:hypothetical protein
MSELSKRRFFEFRSRIRKAQSGIFPFLSMATDELILTPADFTKDAVILFKSESFPVSSFLFSALSRKFKREWTNPLKPVIIETPADRTAILEFVNACQLNKYAITPDNAHDLLALAQEWEVGRLETALLEFMDKRENCECLLIPSLRRALSRHFDTSSLESQLRSHILPMITSDAKSLLTLPISVLSRVLPSSSDSTFDRRPLFDFLVRCLDHYGPSASILFRDLSADVLSAAELMALHSHPQFQKCFIGPSICNALFTVLAEREQQRSTLSALSESQAALIGGLSSRVVELAAKVDRVSAGGDETRREMVAMDSRFQNEIRTFTTATEARIDERMRRQAEELKARFDDRMKKQAEELKERFEAFVLQEIGSRDAALQSEIAAVEGRVRADLQSQSGRCESEIQRQAAETVSRFEAAIAARSRADADAMRVELREQDGRLRREILPLGTLVPLRDSPLDGVIAWLGRRCGGNVIDKNVIVAGPGWHPRRAFDFQNSISQYVHECSSEQWLETDFKQMRVCATDYSIRSSGSYHAPASWTLEGSADGVAWFALDTRTDQAQLCGSTDVFSFSVSDPRLCRHLRFRKTGCALCSSNCSSLYLTAFEVYGVVFGCSQEP